MASAGMLYGVFKHLDEEDKATLRVELLSDDALNSSAIEGEYLNRKSLQSSIRHQFGLEPDSKRIPEAERGMAELTVAIYETWAEKLDATTLFNWHRMVVRGRTDLCEIGCYRSSSDPMQVVSGPIGKRRVHFEAPPASRMEDEMAHFIQWFNSSSATGPHPLPPLTRAGLAHLYFVIIHPFEDGNGRLARALSEKILSQGMGSPSLIALSRTIETNRKHYYDKLQNSNHELEVTKWLTWFAETVLTAQDYSIRFIEFLVKKERFFRHYGPNLNERQNKVIKRMFAEGLDGFTGGLSANNYISIASTSPSSATRDLQELVSMEALRRKGSLRHTRYYLNLNKKDRT